MASVEKMFKMLLEEVHQTAVPLSTIIQNQEIMIIQNRQIIDLLQKVDISSSEN